MEAKTIVITGSTRGIGLGLAKTFLKKGHQVIINGRTAEKVQQMVTELQKISSELIGIAGNVTEQETHNKIFRQGSDRFGKIDIWINNAGIPQPYQLLMDIDNDKIKDLIDINVHGLIIGTKIAAQSFLKQGFGKIFNMEGFGSDGRMMKKLTLYGTSKRAVQYFTKSMAKEIKGSSVQIGILSPGMVKTEFITKPMKSATPVELKSYKKVYDILAEEVDVVTQFLVNKMLESSKNYDRIEFLSKFKLVFKMMKMLIP